MLIARALLRTHLRPEESFTYSNKLHEPSLTHGASLAKVVCKQVKKSPLTERFFSKVRETRVHAPREHFRNRKTSFLEVYVHFPLEVDGIGRADAQVCAFAAIYTNTATLFFHECVCCTVDVDALLHNYSAPFSSTKNPPAWMSQSVRYRPSRAINSSCVPSALIRPSSITMMRSIRMMVDRRCAMTMTVFPSMSSASAD